MSADQILHGDAPALAHHAIPRPEKDWANFACPDCGTLQTLPANVNDPEDRPYCIHANHMWSWKPDHEGKWTRMVLVRAERVDASWFR